MNHTAYLSSAGDFTSFSYGTANIRFRTLPRLIRYEHIKTWDKGYIVTDATYSTAGAVEEYIDLIPILENLLIDPESFLAPIQEVKIQYDNSNVSEMV